MKLRLLTAVVGLTALISACSDESTSPNDGPTMLEFTQASLDLEEAREATVWVKNTGARAEGPIAILPGPITGAGGTEIMGAQIEVDPGEIPTLDPGTSAPVELTLLLPDDPAPGDYEVSLRASVADELQAELGIAFTIIPLPPIGTAASIEITAGSASPRQGDVERYTVSTLDADGNAITDQSLLWTVDPAEAGLVETDARFVGYEPGDAQIIATASGLADTLSITITDRNAPSGSFNVIGMGDTGERSTSDLWVHGDYAYTGTWGCSGSANCGDRLRVWDIRNPASPDLVTEVVVDARTVNDIKVRADGMIAVMTHELSLDGLNGVTILDMQNPGDPQVLSRFTAGLNAGVHNVWIEGDFVYIAVDGVGNGMRVLDISNPSNPRVVAEKSADTSFLHDVYVRDGLAFLSQWNDGLIIVDVGNGIAGGSPENPTEVGRVRTLGGDTHNAWYWPESQYVFVGEEDFGTPGVMHVVDVSNMTRPVEVARFAVPGATPHNFWLDEEREILYLAWYESGLRALDVSGELLGVLNLQGREIASIEYGSGFGCPFAGSDATCTWAPQLHNGRIFISDLNTGLWVLEPTF